MTTIATAAERPERTKRLLLPISASPAEDALRNSPYAELRSILCELDRETLVLRGRVPSFYMKQMAQTIVAKLGIANEVVNLLEVPRTPRDP